MRKSSISSSEFYDGRHRFEHWYRDNTIYFITARCRNRFHAFASDEAKAIFWARFEFYTREYAFVPLVTSLLDNHYHTILYGKVGENLGPSIRHLHGSVAKLANDLLPERLKPFWYDTGKQGYFDGCIRDELQHRHVQRYVLLQGVRHGIVSDHLMYPHTIERVKIDVAVKRAHELGAYLREVPYARYARWRRRRNRKGRG